MSSPLKEKHIQLWFPDLFKSKGGIQVYSAFLLEALQSVYPDVDYDIFLKHDTCSPIYSSFKPNATFHFSRAWPLLLRTPAFAAKIIGSGL